MQPAALNVPTPETAEATLRRELAACYRLVALNGWDEAIQNHLSVLVPGRRDRFLVNPYGLGFDEIRASDLIEVDGDGRKANPENAKANPTVFVLHSAVYEARPEVTSVVHFHSTASSAVSAQAEGLLPLSAHALLYRDAIGYHDFEGLSLDFTEKARIQAALGPDKLVLILRNHGILTVGRTIAEAFMHAFWIETACAVQIQAISGGRPLSIPSQAVQDRTAEQLAEGIKHGYAGAKPFAAFMRKLDRIDPSYKD